MTSPSLIIKSTDDLTDNKQGQIVDAMTAAIEQAAIHLSYEIDPRPKSISLAIHWLLPVPSIWFDVAKGCELEVRITKHHLTATLSK